MAQLKARKPRAAAVVRLVSIEGETHKLGADMSEALDKEPRKLTVKQDQFAKLAGYDALPFSQAYRQAYDCSAMSNESIRQNASREALKPHVSEAIRNYSRKKIGEIPRDPERMRLVLTEKMFEIAVDPSLKPIDRLKAMELLGKTQGVQLFAEIIEHKGNTQSTTEAVDALKARLAALYPVK